jgi:hypothetical protein
VTNPEVVIVVPVLKRPHRVKPLLENIAASTPEGSYRVLFVVTVDDSEQLAAVLDAGVDPLIVGWEGGSPGDFARKTNEGYRNSTEPLIFTGADDLNFHPRWLEAAKACLTPTTGVVGTNDLGNPRVKQGKHSTHSLVRREYADMGTVDEPNKIYCEQYPHQFTDDEMVQTAIARRAFTFAKDSIVEHLHPHWNKGPDDEVYQLADPMLHQGRVVYHRRRHLWRNRRLPRFYV